MEEVTNQLENIKLVENISYKRSKLIESETEKGLLSIDKIMSLTDQYKFQKIEYDKLEFFYYNCEGINDYGWGCAWRCIQTIYGTLLKYEDTSLIVISKVENKFATLFMNYGSREKLDKIFLSCFTQNESIPTDRLYAPFETENAWAEPLIAKLILFDIGLKGDLLLVNGYPYSAYAPEDVFSEKISFSEFKDRLVNHFSKNIKLPVMIDDSLIAVCVIGIDASSEETTTLLFADPHIGQNEDGENGIYHIVLDEKGNFKKELNTHPNLWGARMLFETKPWMIYIPII